MLWKSKYCRHRICFGWAKTSFEISRPRSTFFAAHVLSFPVHNVTLVWLVRRELKKVNFWKFWVFFSLSCFLFTIRGFLITAIVFGDFENADGSSISIYPAIFTRISSTQDVREYKLAYWFSAYVYQCIAHSQVVTIFLKY